jgi:hypothetical protein
MTAAERALIGAVLAAGLPALMAACGDGGGEGSNEGADGSGGDYEVALLLGGNGGEEETTGGARSSGGASSADGGSSSAGGESSSGGATAAGGMTGTGGSDVDCGMQLSGDACEGAGRCEWLADCVSGYCSCDQGVWACGQTDTCAGCPSSTETACGDACDQPGLSCLCRCGGGPNYSACDCVDGVWECSRC